jgi:hypothetical protein
MDVVWCWHWKRTQLSKRSGCVYSLHCLRTRHSETFCHPTSCNNTRYNLYLETVSRNWLRETNYRPIIKESRGSKLRPSLRQYSEFCVPLLACCLCDALQWLAILFHTSQKSKSWHFGPALLRLFRRTTDQTSQAKCNFTKNLYNELTHNSSTGLQTFPDTQNIPRMVFCCFWSSHSYVVEDWSLLGCYTVSTHSYRRFGGTTPFQDVAET